MEHRPLAPALLGTDSTAVVTAWSASATQVLGYAEHEVLGKPVSMLFAAECQEHVAELVSAVHRGQPLDGLRTVWQTRGGTRVEVAIAACPVRAIDGQRAGTAISFREHNGHCSREAAVAPSAERTPADDEQSAADALPERLPTEHLWPVDAQELRRQNARLRAEVAELRVAEAALRDREARLMAILSTAVDGIITIEDNGAIESMNPAAERIFGYGGADVVGQQVRLLIPALCCNEHFDIIAGRGSSEGVDAPGEGVEALGEGVEALGERREMVGRRKDGSLFPLELGVGAWCSGGSRRYTVVLHELTGRKQLEDQLRQVQKMEAVGRLAGGVAHDFNNLLMGIAGCADLALRRLDANAAARRFIEEIVTAAGSGADITRQLLAFSRRRRHRRELHNVDALVSRSAQMLRHLLGEDVDLRLRLAAPRWRVLGDAGQLDQALMNVLVNARDAMPRGGVIAIETAEVHLAPAVDRREGERREPGDYLSLTVRDTGYGMDEETQRRAFEPFFTTKPEGEGTGLGLSTVYGIVRQHGGHVELSSRPGEGTAISMFLPRAVEADEQAAGASDDVSSVPERKTVLVVEDQRLVRMTLRHYLESFGYYVLEAADGREALQLAEQFGGTIHLLLADVVLPAMSGPDVARQLRSTRQDLRVLYVSAYSRDRLLSEGRIEEHELTLAKPFGADELEAKVGEALRGAPSS